MEAVAADAPLPIPALRDGVAERVLRQRRVERGVEDRHVRQVRDRGQAGLHRGHGDAVMERGQAAQRVHLLDHFGRHEHGLPEPLAAVNDAVADGAQRGGQNALSLAASEEAADVMGRVALGGRVHAPVHFDAGQRRESGLHSTCDPSTALSAGMVGGSTTLDLSELDPGSVRERASPRRLAVPRRHRARGARGAAPRRELGRTGREWRAAPGAKRGRHALPFLQDSQPTNAIQEPRARSPPASGFGPPRGPPTHDLSARHPCHGCSRQVQRGQRRDEPGRGPPVLA